MTRFRAYTAVLAGLVLASCSYEKNAVQDITGPVGTAKVKFFNFGVNAPSANFYANDAKVTATTSATGAEAAAGVAYGGVGSGGFYSAIDAGQYNFTAKISSTAVADKDVVIATVPGTLTAGKSHTVFLSGFYDAGTKKVEGFMVEDAYPEQIDYTQTYVRFVNAISNSVPMQMFAKNTTTGTEYPVGAVVAYKSGGAFTALPAGVYDLSTRAAGGVVNLITRTAVSFAAGKVYTIGARGDITVVSTTATNRPFLDNTANR